MKRWCCLTNSISTDIIQKNLAFIAYKKIVYNFADGGMRGDSKRDSTSVTKTKKTPSENRSAIRAVLSY